MLEAKLDKFAQDIRKSKGDNSTIVFSDVLGYLTLETRGGLCALGLIFGYAVGTISSDNSIENHIPERIIDSISDGDLLTQRQIEEIRDITGVQVCEGIADMEFSSDEDDDLHRKREWVEDCEKQFLGLE